MYNPEANRQGQLPKCYADQNDGKVLLGRQGIEGMAKDCCWNCKYYIAKGDNEPPTLSSSYSNVCVYAEKEEDEKDWTERVCPTPPNYVCRHYKERFY